jgi:hypothetical protein
MALYALASLISLAGCASRPRDYLKAEDVPSVTPHHTNDVANSVYRFGYVKGYDDFMACRSGRKWSLLMDPLEAERDGYLAGVAAAYDRYWQQFWRTNTIK